MGVGQMHTILVNCLKLFYEEIITIFILQMRKLRLTEMNYVASVNKAQSFI